MESLKNRVAIIGGGCTPMRDYYDKDADDFLADACFEALADAGLDTRDIQAAWLGGGVLRCHGPDPNGDQSPCSSNLVCIKPRTCLSPFC